MVSDIDAELEQRLEKNGFSADQINEMKTAGIEEALITRILKIGLKPNKLQKVFAVYAKLHTSLPASARVEVYLHEDDIPTFATCVRELSNDDAKQTGEIYQGLADDNPTISADEAYIFDMGRGYVQLRSIYKEGTS